MVANAQRKIESPHQVGEKQKAAGEHADDGELSAVIIAHHLPGHFIHSLLDAFGGD